MNLTEILTNHALWVRDRSTGTYADLSSVDLRGADLSSANLSSANLSSAKLRVPTCAMPI